MSLLMEALKKAERAKQAAQEQGNQAAPEAGELQLTPDDPSSGAPAPETESAQEADAEDAPPSGPNPLLRDPRQGRLDFPKLELESIDDREFDLDPVKPRPARDDGAQTEVRERAAARAVFEAKQAGAGKSRTPVIAGVAAILAVIGIGGYFWMQMQGGGSSLVGTQLATGPVATRPPATIPPAQPATPSPQLAAAPVIAPSASPSLPLAGAGDALAANAAAPRELAGIPQTGKSSPAPRIVVLTETRPRASNLSPSVSLRKTQAPGEVQVSPKAVTDNPQLDAAYNAYAANDMAAARAGYAAVLEREPANRDALLGLAGVAAREHRYDEAETLYLRELAANPVDAYAQTGLISIRSGADPVAAESRLKTLIANQPDSAFLHYALGNLYARQKRWNDAEQEHFRAFSLDSDNADYCFNLAVSLDQIRQSRLALDHYQRALVLAAAKPASFDPDRLRARISELQRQQQR